MIKRVVRFRAIVNPLAPDDAAEAEFIRRGLPRLLSATQGLVQFCFMSRHPTGERGEKDAVWLVCKPRCGKTRELADTGRRTLQDLVAEATIHSYCVADNLTDDTALAERVQGIAGVPDLVSYEACWRYLDAATRVALEALAKSGVHNGAEALGSRLPRGRQPKLGVGEHLAHFLWNALGLQELRCTLAVPDG